MSFWEKFVVFMSGKGEVPEVFGLFHIICLVAMIASTALLCVFFKDCKEKTVRKIALIGWIITVVFELYKQIFYVGYGIKEGVPVWDYAWYAFPYQFCSCTIYLLPFVAFMKEGKVREAIITFLATFSVFAGICNYVYPEQVFVEQKLMNVQTMAHHGIQVVLGIFFLVHRRKTFSFKNFLPAIYVFGVMSAIALLLNEVCYYAFIKDMGDTFNMYFISRHFECTLPVLSIFYPILPYIVFLLVYLVGFSLAGLIFYLIGWGSCKLVEFIKLKTGGGY